MAKGATNWEDNFSKLVEHKISVDGNKEWRLALEEHKTKGTMQMNVRLWQLPSDKEGSYAGPTKNGFIVQIKTPDDINNMEKMFAKFFTEIKEML